jgi:hypothetical protein
MGLLSASQKFLREFGISRVFSPAGHLVLLLRYVKAMKLFAGATWDMLLASHGERSSPWGETRLDPLRVGMSADTAG